MSGHTVEGVDAPFRISCQTSRQVFDDPAVLFVDGGTLADRMQSSAWRSFSLKPIDMVLYCPACGEQHIDEVEYAHPCDTDPLGQRVVWDNPPHSSHLCHGCGHIWRPADVPTNGVAAVKTKGKADAAVVAPIKTATIRQQISDLTADKNAAERYAASQLKRADEAQSWSNLWKVRYKSLVGCGVKGHADEMATKLSVATQTIARLRSAITAVVREEHSATVGIVDLHIIDGEAQ